MPQLKHIIVSPSVKREDTTGKNTIKSKYFIVLKLRLIAVKKYEP